MSARRPQLRHIIASLIVIVIAGVGGPAIAKLDYARPDRANNPRPAGAPQNCTGCHPQTCATDPPSGKVEILSQDGSPFPPACYTPGQVFSLKVKVTDPDPNKKRWGFEVGVQYNEGTPQDFNTAGTLAADGSPTSYSGSADGLRNFITQGGAPANPDGSYPGQAGGAEWKFKWTAPADRATPVCFYVAGLAADGNTDVGGDCTYTNKYCMPQCGVVPTKPSTWGKVKIKYTR